MHFRYSIICFEYYAKVFKIEPIYATIVHSVVHRSNKHQLRIFSATLLCTRMKTKGMCQRLIYTYICLCRNVSCYETDYETAALIARCINEWTLETPSMHQSRQTSTTNSGLVKMRIYICIHLGTRKCDDDLADYKICYARWLQFCRTPTFCQSLPKYDMTTIFGRNFMRTILPAFTDDLKEKLEQNNGDTQVNISQQSYIIIFS